MAAHTPGPWFAINPRIRWRIKDARGNFVMEEGLDVRREADAYLIAAAPDMHAVLSLVDGFCAGGECCPVCSEQPHRSDCALVAVLAKAEGR